MRILNVDDREDNRYLIESLLNGNGYEVVSTANGEEALARLQNETFDLIISDILMPVMDGFQLCRAVKADERLRCIPVIIYTATYTGPKDEDFAMKIGADRFLQKPCEPDVFVQAVRDVLAAAEGGNVALCSTPPAPGEEVLKLYSERLVRKLEMKMLQLEKEAKARKKAEAILRQNEEKYRSLYNSIRDAIVIADTNRTILDCNRAFVDLFGYSPAEISGKKTLVLYEKQEEFDRIGTKLKEHDEEAPHFYSVQFRKKDGSVFPGEVNVSFLRDDEGQKNGFIGLIRDTTERSRAEKIQKDLESQLHQAQKMESVGRLAGGVAHDYNNMLTVIVGYSEMALAKVDPKDTLHRDLLEINKAAVRSADITRQLLAFARKQAIDPVSLDLNVAVESVLKMLRRLIGEEIKLVWLPETNLWPVKMDPSQVDQLLANLCVNASDAIDGVGRISIETGKASFDDQYCADHPGFSPGEYVLLSVSDDGCGMDGNTVLKIFDPFFTTKSVGKGTGLGLAMVYGIVQQNKGFINVYSEPGKGTTFKIYLSRDPEQETEISGEIAVEVPGGHGELILVVEDEASILKFTERILADLGYTLLTAENPNRALQLVKDHPSEIRLLITDVVMPEMNGMELYQQLHEIGPEMKALFMSGYTADVIIHRGVLDKGVNFIQKPFSMRDLATKVSEILA